MVGTEVTFKATWQVRASVDQMFKGFTLDENGRLDSGCGRIEAKGSVFHIFISCSENHTHTHTHTEM